MSKTNTNKKSSKKRTKKTAAERLSIYETRKRNIDGLLKHLAKKYPEIETGDEDFDKTFVRMVRHLHRYQKMVHVRVRTLTNKAENEE